MESLKNFFTRTKEKAQDNPRKTTIWVGIVLLFLLSFLIPVDPPHVSLSGEPILSNGPKWFTNSMLTTLLVDIFLIAIGYLCHAQHEDDSERCTELHGDGARVFARDE